MKKWILLILVWSSISYVKAQEKENIADLDFLYQQIQQLPSYKDQLKNDDSYAQLYQRLRKELNTTDEFEVFQKLSQLIIPIRDNHLGFYSAPDSVKKITPPKIILDSVSLEKKYADFPMDSLEGIYHGGNSKFVIERKQQNEYQVFNLSTGELAGIFYKNKAGSYDMMQFWKYPYAYTLTRNVKLLNRILIGTNYYKGEGKKFYSLVSRKEKYSYKTLENEIGYLSLGTFNSTDQEIKAATDFFDTVKSTINVKNLIVDVRNNGGGGYKNSRQFISFLKSFPGKIYILQNGYTVSNAEQFIISLKGEENVKTLGETTKGTITYGNNYGKTLTFPSNRFMFYPTDMSGAKKELEFESFGIKPDVFLAPFTEDWVVQTIKYLKTNK